MGTLCSNQTVLARGDRSNPSSSPRLPVLTTPTGHACMAPQAVQHGVTVGGEAQEEDAQSSLVAALDKEAAITIYLTKAWRTPRDSTSSELAARYNITMKAVRDVWNLRTWTWVTMPYWSRADLARFLRTHLCAGCRQKGVRSLEEACNSCAKPRRRGRPMQAALVCRGAARPDAAGPGLRTAGHSSKQRPGAAQPTPSVRPAPSTLLHNSGDDAYETYPQFRPAPFAPHTAALTENAPSLGVQSRAGPDVPVIDQGAPWHIGHYEMARCRSDMPFDVAAASLGRAPAVQRQTRYEFGAQQWPPCSAPVVDAPSHKRSGYADCNDWLRQVDVDYCEHQALGGAGHAAGMPRQLQPQQETVPDYQAQAGAWFPPPQDNLAGRSYAAINTGPDNANFFPQMPACNFFHAGNYGAPSAGAGEDNLRAQGPHVAAVTWAQDWHNEHWALSRASMCSDASTVYEPMADMVPSMPPAKYDDGISFRDLCV